MLNPFVIAGLILTGVGLLQEAADEKSTPKPKQIAGPPGPAGAAGAAGAPGKDAKPAAPAKPKKAAIEKPTDG